MKWRLFFGLLLVVGAACDKKTPIVPVTVQLERDIETIDQYLADNGITNAVQDSTGIRYVIHTLGTGPTPALLNCIRTKYVGRLLSDGTQFDANTIKVTLATDGIISGWRLAFQHFPQGTKATMYLPSYYGYKTTATGIIPANSILVFDVELLDVYAYNSAAGYCYDDPLLLPEVQLQKDIVVIDKYLNNNSISATADPSGVRYTIQTLGTGPKPTTANCVKLKYTGKLLTNSVFDENTAGYKAPLVRLIKGLRSALPLLPKGTKATLYIPSALAYGPTGSGSRIPPNANLIFEVEVLDVTDYNATLDYCN